MALWRNFLVSTLLSLHIYTVNASAAGSETLIGIVGRDFVLLGADSSVSQSIALTASNLDKIALVSDPVASDNPIHQKTIAVAAAGDAADADRIVGLLRAHASIREYQESIGSDVIFIQTQPGKSKVPKRSEGLSVQAVAHFARNQIMERLRSQAPMKVCLLVAGLQTAISSSILTSPSLQVQSQLAQVTSPFHLVPEKPSTTTQPEKSNTVQPCLFWLDEYGALQQLKYGAHGLASNFILSILDQGFHDDLSFEEALKLMKECFAQLRKRYIINSPQPPCIKCIDSRGSVLVEGS